jgi:hypothetical protein
MDQTLEPTMKRYGELQTGANKNPLRDWFARDPQPMTKLEFAELLGVSPSYVSQLTRDDPPWPGRARCRRIGVITAGAVTPNDLAGYPPGD